jgi:hypothetical protein
MSQSYTANTPTRRYSFGIVLWELASRRIPWADLPGDYLAFNTKLNEMLKKGIRPVIPGEVTVHHTAFVAVMKRCWQGDAGDRPTFSEVSRDLAAILNSPSDGSP